MDELKHSTLIAVSALKAQGMRMRVVAENLANADSLPSAPGQEPYRRKVVTFKSELDRQTGAEMVKVDRIQADRSEFEKRHEPHHPAAGPDGFVLAPNINPLIELNDVREAQRSYEANLNVINISKAMLKRTVELLR